MVGFDSSIYTTATMKLKNKYTKLNVNIKLSSTNKIKLCDVHTNIS